MHEHSKLVAKLPIKVMNKSKLKKLIDTSLD